ncbi:TonB-dependent receptor [Aestuariicella hydrocarbonica]|uniref:TonB-dependent receptor n=1 Tax=Pseudomaricurvus hydrocarbonicus TaxID=1470433 RepID=A0A9E5MG49_9GAMM|nr:TonB-dependent receptor [Aestuariicella hydrocarbonica]NHO64221.1 TonB-dependent receptor [Aestuariicella hydrocarbonica]
MPAKDFSQSMLATAVAMVSGLMGANVFAQDNTAFTLEEIVVYAQKREQTMLEVPVSVSSYSTEALDRAQVRDVGDLQQVSPSLSVNASSGGSESIFAIRGIGTAGNNAGLEQSVGVFIDGVYRGRPGSALSDYVDVEGIEVLKGPQGTLFGRNTSAGVISVRTAQPSYEAAAGVDVSAGDEGYFQTKTFATGALVDDVLAYRVAASYQQKDGYIHDVSLGEDYNDRDRYSLRGQLLWDIDESMTLRVIADYSESEEWCCAGVPVFQGPTGGVIAALGGTTLAGESGTYGGAPGTYVDSFKRKTVTHSGVENDMEDWGLSGEFNWEFAHTQLTVIGAYRQFEDRAFNDADATGIALLNQEKSQQIDEQSLEIRLASTGAQTVDWMGGFYYFNQDIDYQHPLYFGEDTRAYYDTLLNGAAGLPLVSVIEAGLGMAPGTLMSSEDYTSTETDYNSESAALFGQATWNVTEKLGLTLGLRYSREEKTGDYHWDGQHPYGDLSGAAINTGLVNALTPSFGATIANAYAAALTPVAQGLQFGSPYDDFSSTYDDDNLSGTVSVNYLWSDEFSTYARFAQGYKSGGLNMDRTAGGASGGNRTPNPDAPLFDPEQVTSFEVGVKSRLMNGMLQLNATLFYQTLEDFQANSFDGIAFVVRNAAEVEGKGLELDYIFQPSEHWLFTGGLVLQDIEYSDYPDGSATQTQKDNGFATQNLSGEPVVFTSDINYSGAISYTTDVASALQFTAATSYSYRSEYFTAQDNDPISEQDDYWLFNLSVGLGAQDQSWGVELWSKNVTDEEVYNIVYDAFSQANTYNAWVNEGRTFGLTGRLRF